MTNFKAIYFRLNIVYIFLSTRRHISGINSDFLEHDVIKHHIKVGLLMLKVQDFIYREKYFEDARENNSCVTVGVIENINCVPK